jgi:hypothetical protein
LKPEEELLEEELLEEELLAAKMRKLEINGFKARPSQIR